MTIKKKDLTYDLDEENRMASVIKCVKHSKPFAIEIPKEVTFNGKTYTVIAIKDKAFRNCYNLKAITIPDSVTKIGVYAFDSCGLESATIPDSITSIGDGTFFFCNNLKNITIPDSVTSIGEYAFGHCHSLKSVTIPDGVTEIGNYAFNDCYRLESVTISDSIMGIDGSWFDNCYKLTEIIIPGTNKAFPLWVHLMESGYADLVRQV